MKISMLILILILSIMCLSCTTLKAQYQKGDVRLNIDYNYSALQNKNFRGAVRPDGSIEIDTASNSEALLKAITAAEKAMELAKQAATAGM